MVDFTQFSTISFFLTKKNFINEIAVLKINKLFSVTRKFRNAFCNCKIFLKQDFIDKFIHAKHNQQNIDELLSRMPSNKYSEDTTDLTLTFHILHTDHYGIIIMDLKQKVLEIIATQILLNHQASIVENSNSNSNVLMKQKKKKIFKRKKMRVKVRTLLEVKFSLQYVVSFFVFLSKLFSFPRLPFPVLSSFFFIP
ncbi:hypothetical protein RFI_00632 [Reticulomyxa filosa]|uniref:Uncharacterized protein n=1 Tax=Reticulomyxa filosa TaxID=46433 RepID=X6PD82_RETFI|nr:hypothetical protein RFI_00632 [Reticulomyxa filosa]|eukprot:ETO36430.1 hypothetical protein RFI_00632 [Reticulomyxa filosa]